MIKVVVPVVVAALTGYALHALAQARFDTRSAVTPITSSSSEGVSFAWFYDPADRTVYACQTARGAQSAVDCKAKTNLP
jgi:hypothetical protein